MRNNIFKRSSNSSKNVNDLDSITVDTLTATTINGTVSGGVTLTGSETLTNKTIDADNNTITNIDNNEIKAAAGIDASKIADGSVSNTEFQYLNGVGSSVVGINDTQTLTNKTLTSPTINNGTYTGEIDNNGNIKGSSLYCDFLEEYTTGGHGIKCNVNMLIDPTKSIHFLDNPATSPYEQSISTLNDPRRMYFLGSADGALNHIFVFGYNTGTPTTAASINGYNGDIVCGNINIGAGKQYSINSTALKDVSETLTNKTISGSSNTLSNISNSSLSSGIDASKIADGSVSNTEFQYINSVTSNVQDQIDSKASTTALNNILNGTTSFTNLNVDNLNINTNSITATDTNGSIILSPDLTSGSNITNGYTLINSNLFIKQYDFLRLRDDSFGLAPHIFGLTYADVASTYGIRYVSNSPSVNVFHSFGSFSNNNKDSGTWAEDAGFHTNTSGVTSFRLDGNEVFTDYQTLHSNVTSASGLNLNATQIGNGDVDNTELSYLNGVTSSIQTQLNNKAGSTDLTNILNGTTNFSNLSLNSSSSPKITITDTNVAGSIWSIGSNGVTDTLNITNNVGVDKLNVGETNTQVNTNLTLSSGNTYQINATTVLSNNTLGSGVVNSSLQNLGTQNANLNMGNNLITNCAHLSQQWVGGSVFSSTSATYVTSHVFLYRGSNNTNTISSVKTIAYGSSGLETYNIRLYDVTNAQEICSASGNNTAQTIQTLSAPSNIPTGEAILHLQVNMSGSETVYIFGCLIN